MNNNNCCENTRLWFWKRRKKFLKTLTWRIIATSTTFVVAYALTEELNKSGQVAAVDTALKTVFYYFHEGIYDRATKKGWACCAEDVTDETDIEANDPEANHNETDHEANNNETYHTVNQISDV